MAKPGSGKLKMKAFQQKQWNSTKRSLKRDAAIFGIGKKRRRKKRGCYIATCIYGSYDCPQVWTLRRYRDQRLAQSLIGRAFIHCYYAVSPIMVNLFGNTRFFQRFWKAFLDRMIRRLNEQGFSSGRYYD